MKYKTHLLIYQKDMIFMMVPYGTGAHRGTLTREEGMLSSVETIHKYCLFAAQKQEIRGQRGDVQFFWT